MNTENNKILAEFRGMKIINFKGIEYIENAGSLNANLVEDLEAFGYDWNWLMEVVEKIESLGYWVNSKRNYCLIEYFGNDYEAKVEEKYFVNQKQWAASKIEAVYNACVEFIKWYNNQNPAKSKLKN